MAVLNLDIAQRLDIVCRKGDTFEFSFDIGDATVASLGLWRMQVRPTEDNDSGDPVLEASAQAAGSSVITLNIPSSTGPYNMSAVDAGLYVYDIELYDSSSGARKTYLYGTFKINDDITV